MWKMTVAAALALSAVAISNPAQSQGYGIHIFDKLRPPREGDTSDGPHRRKVRRPISLRVSCQERVFRRRPHHRPQKASCRVLDLRRRPQPLRFSRIHGSVIVLLTAIARNL
jgi:hypothetical protein